MRGPFGPGSVSIGTQPSSKSGASNPSREHTKARSGARQKPLAEQGVAHRLMDHAETARAIVERDALSADQPARARRVVVAQILADPGQGLADHDTEIAQPLWLADAGQFEQLRRINRAAA